MSDPDPRTARAGRGPRLLLAALLGAQVVALLGFAAFYIYELVLGESEDPTRVVMSVVLILVTAAGLGALARAWSRREDWPRTPTLVWSVLLLPVAWGLVQGGVPFAGTLVGVVGLVGLVAALLTPPPARPDLDA